MGFVYTFLICNKRVNFIIITIIVPVYFTYRLKNNVENGNLPSM